MMTLKYWMRMTNRSSINTIDYDAQWLGVCRFFVDRFAFEPVYLDIEQCSWFVFAWLLRCLSAAGCLCLFVCGLRLSLLGCLFIVYCTICLLDISFVVAMLFGSRRLLLLCKLFVFEPLLGCLLIAFFPVWGGAAIYAVFFGCEQPHFVAIELMSV